MSSRFIITLSCPDRPGIVAALSHVLAENGFNITESQQYSDLESGQFFMRVACEGTAAKDKLSAELDPLAAGFDMHLAIHEADKKQRMLILLSKFDHCLIDLIYRQQSGSINMDIAAIASNHETGRHWAQGAGLAYHGLGQKQDKADNEARLNALIDEAQIDLIVLARYMQIIPPSMCERYPHQLINIHHSFLPSFIGADPYQKAFERGVKLIGATCHYVTDDLDEGPILEQDVARVGHKHDRDDMVRLGKDVEARVLAQGLRYHLEDRVIVDGNKTVIFD